MSECLGDRFNRTFDRKFYYYQCLSSLQRSHSSKEEVILQKRMSPDATPYDITAFSIYCSKVLHTLE